MAENRRKVLIVDSMGGDLGVATTRRLAAPYEGRFETVRVEARERPGWAAVLGSVRRGEVAGVLYTGSKAGVYEKDPWIADLLAEVQFGGRIAEIHGKILTNG